MPPQEWWFLVEGQQGLTAYPAGEPSGRFPTPLAPGHSPIFTFVCFVSFVVSLPHGIRRFLTLVASRQNSGLDSKSGPRYTPPTHDSSRLPSRNPDAQPPANKSLPASVASPLGRGCVCSAVPPHLRVRAAADDDSEQSPWGVGLHRRLRNRGDSRLDQLHILRNA